VARPAGVGLLTVVSAICLVLLLGCGRDTPTSDSSQVGTERFSAGDREPAPLLAGPTLTGSTVALDQELGNIVVLNAWASWCIPCIEEMPILIANADEYRNRGVTFLGLNTSDQLRSAEQFAEDFGINFESIRDPDGTLLQQIPGVPPRAIPSTIVIDRNGDIAARIIGPVTEDGLADIISDLLAENDVSL
jgi:thiol-disulfide isomerase/thioredoxin